MNNTEHAGKNEEKTTYVRVVDGKEEIREMFKTGEEAKEMLWQSFKENLK